MSFYPFINKIKKPTIVCSTQNTRFKNVYIMQEKYIKNLKRKLKMCADVL